MDARLVHTRGVAQLGRAFVAFCELSLYIIYMDKEKLVQLVSKGYSTWSMSRELGVGQTTIRYWLKKYDIRTLNNGKALRHKCSCGETNPVKFYGNKRRICGKCHNQQNIKRGHEKRLKAIRHLGGKCIKCGYMKYSCSINIHHTNPDNKDPNFSSMRGWSWKRIEKEMEECVLLCSNCHSAVHAGHIEL